MSLILIINILSWVASGFSILSNILVAQKKVIGAIIWTFSTLVLFLIALYKKEWSQVFLFGVYDIINLFMWITWSKSDKKERLNK